MKKTVFGTCYQILVSLVPHLNVEVLSVCPSLGSWVSSLGQSVWNTYHSCCHVRTSAVSTPTDAELIFIVITEFPN